jgi:hypothetical protein
VLVGSPGASSPGSRTVPRIRRRRPGFGALARRCWITRARPRRRAARRGGRGSRALPIAILMEALRKEAMPRLLSNLRRGAGRNGKPNRRRAVTIAAGAAGAVGVEGAVLWLRTSRIGGNVVVRCREGHLFTTIWIPGGSLKAIRLGWWRFQRCPVGDHWSLVTPVRESELSEKERRSAHTHKDIRLP